MSDYLAPLRLTPTSSILAMSFVCIDGVASVGQGGWLCRQATSPAGTDLLIAVSQAAYDLPPNIISALTQGTATYTQVAALAGEQAAYYHSGDVCPLVLGVGGCTAGALMGNDTSGNGIMVAKGSGKWYGGVALQEGNAGEIVDILTHFGTA